MDSQSEMSVDIVDSAIVQDNESKLDLRNQEKDVSDIVGEGNEGSKDLEQVVNRSRHLNNRSTLTRYGS